MNVPHEHHHHAGHDHHAGGGHAKHDHGPAGAGGAGNRQRLFIAALLTCVFMLVEAFAGFFTGSLALLADAGHMLTDSVALVLAYVAYRMGDRPGTSRMTYGFDRLKVLIAYTNGLTVLGIAFLIVVEAIGRMAEPAPILGGAMLAVAGIGLGVNVLVFIVLHGGDRESLNLRGAILHVLGDLLGSVATIAAALIILTTGWLPADPLLSVLVALLLIGSAWRLMRESGLILLEGAPQDVDRNSVAHDVEKNAEGVVDIHHMHVWTLDGKQRLATLHARLSRDADAARSIAAIKERLRQKHGIRHATVEVETGPGCPDDDKKETEERNKNGTA